MGATDSIIIETLRHNYILISYILVLILMIWLPSKLRSLKSLGMVYEDHWEYMSFSNGLYGILDFIIKYSSFILLTIIQLHGLYRYLFFNDNIISSIFDKQKTGWQVILLLLVMYISNTVIRIILLNKNQSYKKTLKNLLFIHMLQSGIHWIWLKNGISTLILLGILVIASENDILKEFIKGDVLLNYLRIVLIVSAVIWGIGIIINKLVNTMSEKSFKE